MRHEREPTRRSDEPPARDAEPLPEHALLALQRTAGNRAVGAMLARDVTPTAEPTDAKEAAPSGPHVIVPGIGAIPIESYNLADRSRIRSPAGRGEDEEAPKKDKDQKDDELPGGEIGFNSVQGEHSTALFRWNVDGKPKDIVIVHAQGASTLRITCKGALIATMSVSNDDVPREHWSVDCRAMKFEFSQPGG